jgi:hypothetical protein
LKDLVSAGEKTFFVGNAALTASTATHKSVFFTVDVIACKIRVRAFDTLCFNVQLALVDYSTAQNCLFCL